MKGRLCIRGLSVSSDLWVLHDMVALAMGVRQFKVVVAAEKFGGSARCGKFFGPGSGRCGRPILIPAHRAGGKTVRSGTYRGVYRVTSSQSILQLSNPPNPEVDISALWATSYQHMHTTTLLRLLVI